jgi:acetoin utilization transport system permease protein
MVGGGLFEKEFKQVRSLCIFLFLFNSFALPFTVWSEYSSYLDFLKKYPDSNLEPFVFQFGADPHLLISSMFLFFIAINQMGTERARGMMDFTLSLPYKRSKIFLVKWALVFGIILSSTLISFILTGSYLEWFEIAVSQPTFNYYFTLFSTLAMVYTLTLAAGTLTGTPFAQGLTAVSAAILPLLFALVLTMNADAFGNFTYEEMEKWFEFGYLITPALQFFGWRIFQDVSSIYPFYFLIPGGMAILFFFVGYFSFIKHPNERNGNFFLWKQLNLPVQIIVILLGVLGFSAVGYGSSNESFTGYLIGAVIGAAIGIILSYYLIYKKTKQA